MGFWNKLGKIALQAAPYVAAPFTGGASLMATGATQKLGQKWAEHDANEAAKKGLGPSKFDSMLGKASGLAGAASSLTGGFGGKLSGGKVGTGLGAGASKASIASVPTGGGSGWQGALGSLIGKQGGSSGGDWQNVLSQLMASRNPGGDESSGTAVPRAESGSGLQTVGDRFAQQTRGVMPSGGFDYNHNPMNQYNQNNPNLATSIFQGRMEGMGYPPPSIMDNPDTLTPQIPQNPRRRNPEYQ